MLFRSGGSDNPDWVWGIVWVAFFDGVFCTVLELRNRMSTVSQISLWWSCRTASSQLNSQWLQLPVRPTLSAPQKSHPKRQKSMLHRQAVGQSLDMFKHSPESQHRRREIGTYTDVRSGRTRALCEQGLRRQEVALSHKNEVCI